MGWSKKFWYCQAKKHLACVCLVSVLFPSVNLSAFTFFGTKTQNDSSQKSEQDPARTNNLRATTPTATNQNLISILVEESLLTDKTLRNKIERYALDAQTAIKGQSILISIPPTADPFEIYEGNAALYLSGLNNDQQSQLVGTILIGDIPLPVVEKNGQEHVTIYPYTDFEETDYQWHETKKKFIFTATGNQTPEIWHGVIKSNSDQPSQDLINYFDQNHQVHQGQTTWNKKILYLDLPTQKIGIPDTLQQSYQNWINNAEDIIYNRFTKEMVSGFLTDMAYEDLIPDAYIPSGRNELVPTDYQSSIQGSNTTVDLSQAPDLFAKNMVEAFIKRYFELNQPWLSRTNDLIQKTGRWQPENIDTTISLVSKKDEAALKLLKDFNDALEQKIWTEVETQNIAKDITIPIGGTLRQKTTLLTPTTTYDYFTDHKETCPITHSCEFIHFPTYWNGEKITDWTALAANESVQKCSLLRGNETGKIVEMNRVFDLNYINPTDSNGDIENYCLENEVTKCCALIDEDNPDTVLREQCRFEDVISFDFNYGNTDAYRFFEDEDGTVDIENDIFDEEKLSLFDPAGTTTSFSNNHTRSYIGAKGCEPIIIDNKSISGLSQITTNQKKTFSSLMNHIEPTPATIMAQYQKVQSSPASDLPVDNPRGLSFYDNGNIPTFQRIDYPNIFSLRQRFTNLDKPTREQNLFNEIDTLLSQSVQQLNNTGGNTGKINTNLFDSLWNTFDKSALVEAITWIDQSLEQKNIKVMTGALSGQYQAQKTLLDPHFDGYEVIYINGTPADTDEQTYQVAFEQGAQTPSDFFNNLKLTELNQTTNQNIQPTFYGTDARKLFASNQSDTTKTNNNNTGNNDETCDRRLLTWSKTCLIPWVKSIPDWFRRTNKLVPQTSDTTKQTTTNDPNKNILSPLIISGKETSPVVTDISVSPSEIFLANTNRQPVQIKVQLWDEQNNFLTKDYQTTVSIKSDSSELNQFFRLISPAEQSARAGEVHFLLSPKAVTYGAKFSINIQTGNITKNIPVTITSSQIQALADQNQLTAGQTNPVTITAKILDNSNQPNLDFNDTNLIFSTEDGSLNTLNQKVVNGEAQVLFFAGIVSGEAVIKVQDQKKQLPPDFVYLEIKPDQPAEIKVIQRPNQIIPNTEPQTIQLTLADQYGNHIPSQNIASTTPIFSVTSDPDKGLVQSTAEADFFTVQTTQDQPLTLNLDSPLVATKTAPVNIPVINQAQLNITSNQTTYRAGEIDFVTLDLALVNPKKSIVQGNYGVTVEQNFSSEIPNNLTLKDGKSVLKFSAPTKAGSYAMTFSMKGIPPARFNFTVKPNIAHQTKLSLPQTTVESDSSTPVTVTVAILDAYDNQVDQVTDLYYLLVNPNDIPDTNLATKLQTMGVTDTTPDTKTNYAQTYTTNLNPTTPPSDLATFSPTITSNIIWDQNFSAIPLSFTTGGQTNVSITPKGTSGQLYLAAVGANQTIIPSTSQLSITEVLSRQDFNFLSPKSLLTILVGTNAGDLTAPNLAQEFLFSGQTQAVLAATGQSQNLADNQKLGFNNISVEDGQTETNLGWNRDWQPTMLLAAGNQLGTSAKFGASDALVLYGDPTLSLPKNNPETALGLTEDTGSILWKNPQGVIQQVLTGDLNLDGRAEIFALTDNQLQAFYHDQNQLDNYRHTGPILRFAEGVTHLASYPDIDKSLAFIIQVTSDGNLVFHENKNGVLNRTTKNLGIEAPITNVQVGFVNQDKYADLVVLDTNNTLWFVHGRAGREFFAAQKLYDFAPQFKNYTETYDPNTRSNQIFETDSEHFLGEFFVNTSNENNDLGILGARTEYFLVENQTDQSSQKKFVALNQTNQIKSSLTIKGSANNAIKPGDTISHTLAITTANRQDTLQMYLPDLSGFKNQTATLTCQNCLKKPNITQAKNGIIVGDIQVPTNQKITLAWQATALSIPAITFLVQDFAGQDGIDDIAVPWTQSDGTRQFIKFISSGTTQQYPLRNKTQPTTAPKQIPQNKPLLNQLSANSFQTQPNQALNQPNLLTTWWKNWFQESRKTTFIQTTKLDHEPSTPAVNSFWSSIVSIFKQHSHNLTAQAIGGKLNAANYQPPSNNFPPTHHRVIDEAFPDNARSPLMNGTADYNQLASDALTALSTDHDQDGLPDNYSLTPVEIALKTISCGGRCGLPIPSYAFMAPGQQSLYIPPFGFPSLPTLPIPGVGLPALQIIPAIPFVLPFTPSLPISLFRLFIAPTITGQVGISICVGPPTGFSIPPLPVGNCFVVIPPLLELIGACPVNILGNNNSPALLSLQTAFVSGNTGTVLPKPKTAITNQRVVSADIITTWLQAQFNEFSNFRLPKINFSLPRSPNKNNKPTTTEQNAAKNLIASLEQSEFFRVKREVITIPYPNFSKKELTTLKQKWQLWKKDFAVWKCESTLGTWDESNKNCDQKKPKINAKINQTDIQKVMNVQMQAQMVQIGQTVITELETAIATDNELSPEQVANLKTQVQNFKTQLPTLAQTSSDQIDQITIEDPRLKSSFETYKTEQKKQITDAVPNNAKANVSNPERPSFDLPDNFNSQFLQKMELDQSFGSVEKNVETFEKNLESLESYAQFAEDIQKVPQQMKKIFYPNGEASIPNIQNTPNANQANLSNRSQNRVEQAESHIETYINTYFSTWMSSNKQALTEWGQFKNNIFNVLKIWESIPQIFAGLSNTCAGCEINRGSMLEWALRIILGAIKLPIIPMPQLQDMTLDFSNLKIGLNITIPDIQLEPTNFQVPDLPKLPRITEAVYAKGIEGLSAKLITQLLNVDYSRNFDGISTQISNQLLTQIKTNTNGSFQLQGLDLNALSQNGLPVGQIPPTSPINSSDPTQPLTQINTNNPNLPNLGTLGAIQLIDLIGPVTQGQLETTLQTITTQTDIAGIPGLPDIAQNITGAIPSIPAFPSLPQIASLGLDVSPPVIDLPMLPTMIRPPILPNFLEPVQALLQIPKPVFKILCFISAGIIPIPEWKVASRIQEATNRSTLLPMDTFAAALTSLSPSFPSVNLPNFNTADTEKFRLTSDENGAKVAIINDFTESFTQLNEKVLSLQNIARCTTQQIGALSRGQKNNETCELTLVGQTITPDATTWAQNQPENITLTVADITGNDPEKRIIDSDFIETQTEKIRTILTQKLPATNPLSNQEQSLDTAVASLLYAVLSNEQPPANLPQTLSALIRQTQATANASSALVASTNTIDLGKIPTQLPSNFDINAYQDKIFEQSMAAAKPALYYYDSSTDTAESIMTRDLANQIISLTVQDLDGDNQAELVYSIGSELYFKRRQANLNALKQDKPLSNQIIRWDYQALAEKFVPTSQFIAETLPDGGEINFVPLHTQDTPAVTYAEWTITERPDHGFETNTSARNREAKKIDRVGFLFRPAGNKYSIRPVSATIKKVDGSPILYGSRLKSVQPFKNTEACEDSSILKPFYPNETLLIGLENETVFQVKTKNREANVPKSEWKKIHKGEETFVDFAEVCVIRGQLAEVEIHTREIFNAKKNDYLLDEMELILGEQDQVEIELFDGRIITVHPNEIYQMNIIEDEPTTIQKFKKISLGNQYGLFQSFTQNQSSARLQKLLHDPQTTDDQTPPEIIFATGNTIRTLPLQNISLDASNSIDTSGIVQTIWSTDHPELKTYLEKINTTASSDQTTNLAITIPPRFVTKDFSITLTAIDAAGNQTQATVNIWLKPVEITIQKISDANSQLTARINPPLDGSMPVMLTRTRNKVTETTMMLSPTDTNVNLKINEDEGSVALVNQSNGTLLAEVLSSGRPVLYDPSLSTEILTSDQKNPLRAVILDQAQTPIFQIEFVSQNNSDDDTTLVPTIDLDPNDSLRWQTITSQTRTYQNMQALIDTQQNQTLGVLDTSGQFYTLVSNDLTLSLQSAKNETDALVFQVLYQGKPVAQFRPIYEEKVWIE